MVFGLRNFNHVRTDNDDDDDDDDDYNRIELLMLVLSDVHRVLRVL